MNNTTWPWLATVGIMTWRDVANKSRPPVPSELLATFVVFGGLSFMSNNPTWSKVALVTGWGLTLAVFMNLIDPAHPGSLKVLPGSATNSHGMNPPTQSGTPGRQTQ